MLFRKKWKAAAPPAPVMMPVTAPSDLDARGLGRVLWQKKTGILGFTLFAAAAALLVVNSITPRYRSESHLLLEPRENVYLRAVADKIGSDRSSMIDPEAVTSQIQVVLSRDLAREVIKKENLADNPEFNPMDGGSSLLSSVIGLFRVGRDLNAMSKEERTLEAYYDRLNVYALEKSRVIVVSFSSVNSDLAARVANSIAKTYLSMQQTTRQDQTRAAGNWLAEEIEKMRNKVADAEAKVEQYRVKSDLFVGSNNNLLPNQQITEINSQIAMARWQKADLEARARQLRDLIRSGNSRDSADIANSDSMRRLIEQRGALRSQLVEQSTTLLGRHPRIKELKAQIGDVDGAIKSEGERLARQLDNDAKVASYRLETLAASLDTLKKLASQSNAHDVQLRALEREAKTQRDLLESYLTKYREVAARDNINAAPPEARIISRATSALKPAYPKKLPTVLIVAFAAFALSTGFNVTGVLLASDVTSYDYAYTPAGFDAPTYTSPMSTAPAMQRMASPSLVPMSVVASAATNAAMPLTVSAVEQIAYKLRQSGGAGRLIAVVGSQRNIGATFTAIALARALATNANVVLVDLAFDAPNVSVISADPTAPGIAELVRGSSSFGDIITRDQYSPLHLIATGDVGDDGPVIAASPMLARVIEALARSYDHVLIDIGSATDGVIGYFAALSTSAVLVVADPVHPATRAACERLMLAGFADLTVLTGKTQAAAA